MELVFGDAVGAYRWAQAFAARPDVKSIFATYGMPKGPVVGLTYNESAELAYTVTALAHSIEPAVARQALIAAHGDIDPEDREALEQTVAAAVHQFAPIGRVTPASLRLQWLSQMAVAELWHVHNKHRDKWLPMRQYARAMRLSKSSVQSWRPAIDAAREKLAAWHAWGVNKLDELLRERDLIAD